MIVLLSLAKLYRTKCIVFRSLLDLNYLSKPILFLGLDANFSKFGLSTRLFLKDYFSPK
jgi:hypothetical protein